VARGIPRKLTCGVERNREKERERERKTERESVRSHHHLAHIILDVSCREIRRRCARGSIVRWLLCGRGKSDTGARVHVLRHVPPGFFPWHFDLSVCSNREGK